MAVTSAYRRAGLLRYAAAQFVALTAAAMALYAGGTWFDREAPRYEITGNFLSDLGMTHALSGAPNYASCALFAIALATIGVALIAFAQTWRDFAFARGRARAAGIASRAFGTASGAAFAGVACTPWDLALTAHNALVLAAFGLLLGYIATLTIAMARNGASRGRIAANLVYLAVVVAYVLLVLVGPRQGSEHGHRVQVTGQKIVAYASMIHVMYLATTVRRALACP